MVILNQYTIHFLGKLVYSNLEILINLIISSEKLKCHRLMQSNKCGKYQSINFTHNTHIECTT